MAKYNSGYERLRNAFRRHKMEKAEQLLAEGISIDVRYPGGNTSLHWSIENAYVHGIFFCLENNASVNAQNNEHCTPLHSAVRKDHLGLARLLLENGANVNAQDIRNKTPLHFAHSADVVCLLLEFGAEIYSISKYEQFPMQTTWGTGQVELIKRHFANSGKHSDRFNDNRTLLFFSDTEATNFLIDCGADVNAQNDWGDTPLHMAIERRNIVKVRALLASGANVYLTTKIGRMAMSHAVRQPDILQLLIQRGADVNKPDENHDTPLQISIGVSTESMRLLLDAGADVHGRTRGWLPLHLAAMDIDPDYVRILLKYNADPNRCDASKNTALHEAAGRRRVDSQWQLAQRGGNNGNAEVLRLLIGHGADVNATSMYGRMPLHLAVERGSLEATQILVDNSADINALVDRQTPLNIAKKKGWTEIEQYLIVKGAVKATDTRFPK